MTFPTGLEDAEHAPGRARRVDPTRSGRDAAHAGRLEGTVAVGVRRRARAGAEDLGARRDARRRSAASRRGSDTWRSSSRTATQAAIAAAFIRHDAKSLFQIIGQGADDAEPVLATARSLTPAHRSRQAQRHAGAGQGGDREPAGPFDDVVATLGPQALDPTSTCDPQHRRAGRDREPGHAAQDRAEAGGSSGATRALRPPDGAESARSRGTSRGAKAARRSTSRATRREPHKLDLTSRGRLLNFARPPMKRALVPGARPSLLLRLASCRVHAVLLGVDWARTRAPRSRSRSAHSDPRRQARDGLPLLPLRRREVRRSRTSPPVSTCMGCHKIAVDRPARDPEAHRLLRARRADALGRGLPRCPTT